MGGGEGGARGEEGGRRGGGGMGRGTRKGGPGRGRKERKERKRGGGKGRKGGGEREQTSAQSGVVSVAADAFQRPPPPDAPCDASDAPTACCGAKKQKKCQLNRKKGVLSWIPFEMHSTFTGVHRAFSYGNRERSLASTERSLMDTIRNALEFTERSLMDPQSVLSWTPFEMHWNSS